MSFDSVLEHKIGALGQWQIMLSFLLFIPSNIPLTMIPQLANLSPSVVCSGPWFDGWTYNDVANTSEQIASLQQRLNERGNRSTPVDLTCQRYDLSEMQSILLNNQSIREKRREILTLASETNLTLQRCDDTWLYDENTAMYRHSLIQDFDMVCDRQSLIPNSGVFYVIGMAIGVITGGQIGDRFGRRTVICISYPLCGIVAMMALFCSNVFLFFILRLFLGFTNNLPLTSVVAFVLESTNHKHRNTLSVLDGLTFDIFGQNIITLFSYVLQDWRWMHFTIGAIMLLFSILFFFFLPESPRWLAARGRYDEALHILRKAAIMNSKTKDVANAITKEDIRLTTNSSDVYETKGCGFYDWIIFFTSRKSTKRWLPLSVIWIAVAVSYYGIAFYGVRLQGNPYLIAFVMSVAVIPTKFVHWILVDKIDRKIPLVGLLVFSLMCTVGGYLGQITEAPATLVIVCATLSVSSVSTAVDIIYLVSPELFPTLYRAKALGFLSSTARLGAVGGLFAERLPHSWPLFTFAVALGLALLCCIFLPRGDYKTMTEGTLNAKRKNSETDSQNSEQLALSALKECDSQENQV